jgi:hypothetical protein
VARAEPLTHRGVGGAAVGEGIVGQHAADCSILSTSCRTY